MGDVERLVAAGIRPDCARETVLWFRAQGDDMGLQRYIREAEERHALQILQSKRRAECG